MQFRSRRSNHFEIGKEAAGTKLPNDLGKQGLLPFIFQVMDCEPRKDDIESAEGLDGVSQVPRQHAHPRIREEPFGRPGQHRFGKVDPDHPSEPGSSLEGKSDQPAVAAPEVEHRSGFGGQHRLEDFFPSQPGR